MCISYIPGAGMLVTVFQAELESCQYVVVVVGPCRLAVAVFAQTDAVELAWWAAERRLLSPRRRPRFLPVSVGTSAASEAYSAPVPPD